jgi:hypothetical protein
MKIRFFLKGIVIFLVAMPFLFPGVLFSQSKIILSLHKEQGSDLFIKSNKIAALTFTHNENMFADSLNPDSSITTVKPKQQVTKKFQMKKSPTKAVIFSAILPGAGQFYNESYWKIPIVGGLVGYFGYEYFRQNNLYKDYRDLYSATQTPENPSGDLNLKALREFYRDQRDDFVWYFMIVYVVNLVDAYIDAHLFDFDVSEEKQTRFGKVDRTYRLNFNLKL